MNRRSSNLGALVRFALGMVGAAAVTFWSLGAAGVTGPTVGASPSPDNPAADAPAGFIVAPATANPPTPLGPPPGDQLIQLVSFNKDAPPPLFGERAPWWTPAGVPRVDHITQFDGGPLDGSNSVVAAGAMLARLGHGIVTTGSQLRTLAGIDNGGASLLDLQRTAMSGWDADYGLGMITSSDLRAVLEAGGGAVVIVDYGVLPLELRTRADFGGLHALYFDAFDPGAARSAAAYFVMDPLGEPWHGYHGDWWPADIVDRAAKDFGAGAIAALWTFAGGIPPNSSPDGSSSFGAGIRTAVGEPGAGPPADGGLIPSEASQGDGKVVADLGVCLRSPTPAFCPAGILAEYPGTAGAPPTVPPHVGNLPIDLLYTDVPQPGLWRIFIEAPVDTLPPTFAYWRADGSGPVLKAVTEPVTLGGKPVYMVVVPIPESGSFAFLASSVQNGVVTASDVGAISFGN